MGHQNTKRREGLRTEGGDISQHVRSCHINVFKHGGNLNEEDQKMIESEWQGVGGRAKAHKADANWITTDGLLEWRRENTDSVPVTQSLRNTLNENGNKDHVHGRFKG